MTLALADELFLITHDLQSGKARIADPALGIGLSSALLAELVFAGALVIAEGHVVLGDYPPPADRLSEALFEQTRQQLHRENVTVGGWLADHRRLVVDLVADRMIRAGELRREQGKRFGRTIVRYRPSQPADAFIRVQRLGSYLRTRSEISAGDAALAALVTLLAPGGDLLDIDESDRQYLQQIVPLLPFPLRELLAVTESSILAAQRSPHL